MRGFCVQTVRPGAKDGAGSAHRDGGEVVWPGMGSPYSREKAAASAAALSRKCASRESREALSLRRQEWQQLHGDTSQGCETQEGCKERDSSRYSISPWGSAVAQDKNNPPVWVCLVSLRQDLLVNQELLLPWALSSGTRAAQARPGTLQLMNTGV